MKYLLAFLCLVASASAIEITVEDTPRPLTLPAECSKMTDAEFFAWAVLFNHQQREQIVYGTEPRWVEREQRNTKHVITPYGIIMTDGYYPTRRLNPDYQPASPLTIINPFCKPE